MKDYVNYIVLFIILFLIGLISVNLYTNSKFRDDVNIYAKTMKNTGEAKSATDQVYTKTKVITDTSSSNNQENPSQSENFKEENTDATSPSEKENNQLQEKPNKEEKNNSALTLNENFIIEVNNN